MSTAEAGTASGGIGIDVGGTKIAAGIVSADGRIEDWTVVPSRASDPAATAAGIADVAEKLWRRDDIGAIGVGAAGLVDFAARIVRYAPNLRYRELSVADVIVERLGTEVPIVVDNDANVAAWGEYRLGAGRGASHMILVTVGTGIGGGIVVDGGVFRGANGMGGEIGHMSIDPQGPYCGCGQRGCWERLASGTALARMGSDAVLGVPGSAILALAGGDAHAVTGHDVTQAAAEGDELAIELVHQLGVSLGRGLVNLANIFDPDLFVIGGGLMSVGEPMLAPAREELNRNIEGAGHRPAIPVVPAELGERSGVVGAGLLALGI